MTVIKFLLVFLVLGALIYFSTIYATPLKEKVAVLFHLSSSQVKGASTRADLPDHLKKDVATQAAILKKNAMNVKVSDFLNFFGRTKKIVTDVKSVASGAATQAEKLFPHK